MKIHSKLIIPPYTTYDGIITYTPQTQKTQKAGPSYDRHTA